MASAQAPAESDPVGRDVRSLRHLVTAPRPVQG